MSDGEEEYPRPGRKYDETHVSDDGGFDDDNHESRGFNRSQVTEPIVVNDGDDSGSDGEFAELRAKARARVAAKASDASVSAINGTLTKEEILAAKVKARLEQYKKTGSISKPAKEISSKKAAPVTPNPDDDLILQILLASELEGTKAMMFKCRPFQEFGLIKNIWLNSHKALLTEEQTKSIFLTWKRTKVFDTTKMKRIMDVCCKNGVIDTSGEGFHEGQLYLEAWTPEAFESFKAEKQKALQRPQEEEEEEEEEDTRAPSHPPERRWNLYLKARGMKDFRLSAKASTKIAKVAAGFRKAMAVAPEKKITLWFDGEELDGETEVKDTELEDQDAIEVHIK